MSFEGGCDCRYIRYRMTDKPLFVHCCHCRWCQRETGSAFVLNAMIEADRVELLHGEVDGLEVDQDALHRGLRQPGPLGDRTHARGRSVVREQVEHRDGAAQQATLLLVSLALGLVVAW